MAGAETEICCCSAGGWTKVFAWLQIIGGVIGVIGFSVVVANFDKIEYPDETKDDRELILTGFWVLLSSSVVTLILGIILLVGTTKEKIGLLWIWIIIECVTTIGILVARIIEATKRGLVAATPAFFTTVIFCFVIYCVWSRIRDIKASRQGVKPSDEDGTA